MMADEYGKNADGELVHFDAYGQPYVLDEAGNKRPPMRAEPTEHSSGFTTYDTSQGHCGLCGRLTCNGGCFK